MIMSLLKLTPKTMFKRNQKQSSGDSSTNIQAGTVNINGITYEQARQIAIEVYRNNALELAGIAKDTAASRAEQITERFLKELSKKNASAIQSASDPDFQHSVFEAQKAFARSGDQELEDVLVNLLTTRASEPIRNLKQVVLNEAISVTSKLTKAHIDTITLLFRLRHTVRFGLFHLSQVGTLIASEMLPFCNEMPNSDATYRYLAFTGVATVEMTQISFIGLIRNSYPGLCSKGVDEATRSQLILQDKRLEGFLIKLSGLDDKYHLAICTPELLETTLQQNGIENSELISQVKGLLHFDPLTDQEIEDVLVGVNPAIKELMSNWDRWAAKNTILTPVGLAIGHANATKMGTLDSPLDIWVN